ncbi:ATP-binding cassette domain-containing protein [Aquimarina sp. TRL1]|nr:ATP-binding cassette domain-containing protein [Aquimarina sp. TRL1]
MIQTQNIHFQYKKEKKMFRFPDIHLERQEHLLILGVSGIGKTTFLHILAGILKPNKGSVKIGNIDISLLSNRALDTFRGSSIGLVFQKNLAIPSLSLLDSLKARLFFSKKPIDSKRINALLKRVQLYPYKHKKIRQLSQGQLQRLSIALAVIHQPTLILADEPTSSLDTENCNNMMQLLLEEAKEHNANLIVITHDDRIKPLFTKSITL